MAIVVVAMVAQAGCSVILIEKPATSHSAGPQATPSCSSGTRPVIADAMYGVFAAGLATLYYADSRSRELDDTERIVMPVAAGLGIIGGVSAVLGWRWVGRCRELQDRHDGWLLDTVHYGAVPSRSPASVPAKRAVP